MWTYEVLIHAQGDWGYGIHNTSNIEYTWAHLKNEIKLELFKNCNMSIN